MTPITLLYLLLSNSYTPKNSTHEIELSLTTSPDLNVGTSHQNDLYENYNSLGGTIQRSLSLVVTCLVFEMGRGVDKASRHKMSLSEPARNRARED